MEKFQLLDNEEQYKYNSINYSSLEDLSISVETRNKTNTFSIYVYIRVANYWSISLASKLNKRVRVKKERSDIK